MQLEGAVIREQGHIFAIVIVKPHILNHAQDFEEAQRGFAKYFPGMPIVLMAQDYRGIPTYRGRKDIVNFLASVDISQIPWKRYTFD